MRDEDDLDHYDVLEVEPDAAADEIERSYRVLSAAYEGDSLATYSLFGAEEAEQPRSHRPGVSRASDPASRRLTPRASAKCLRKTSTDEPVTLRRSTTGWRNPRRAALARSSHLRSHGRRLRCGVRRGERDGASAPRD
jgi:hypothetical protein